jgi:hypothetical protein
MRCRALGVPRSNTRVRRDEHAGRRPRLARALATVMALGMLLPAMGQDSISVPLGGATGSAVVNALAQECYEAGLIAQMLSDAIMDCSAVLEERVLNEQDGVAVDTIVVRHKLRFTLLERAAGEGRIGADAWTETEELGTAIEEPITSADYLRRVQGVLTTVVARLNDRGAPPWAGRYDDEQAWHLDAHLKAVSHCDAGLSRMTAAGVAEQLESIGLRPLHDDTRDRCEQLYTHLYEWGLARGDATPTLETYLRYRAALPAEQRTCSGQLAPEASCRR